MNLGVEALAGYFFTDDWMVLGKASIQHSGNKDVPTYLLPVSVRAIISYKTASISVPIVNLCMPGITTTT